MSMCASTGKYRNVHTEEIVTVTEIDNTTCPYAVVVYVTADGKERRWAWMNNSHCKTGFAECHEKVED